MAHGVHKNQSVSWHPKDPTLKPWLEAEASSRGTTKSDILDEALAEYRGPLERARSVDVSAVNAEMRTGLRGATRETTQTGEPA